MAGYKHTETGTLEAQSRCSKVPFLNAWATVCPNCHVKNCRSGEFESQVHQSMRLT